MKWFLKYFVSAVVLGSVPGGILFLSAGSSEKVLGSSDSPTPTLVSSPTPTPTPTLTSTPTPTIAPTLAPTPIPAPTIAPELIHSFIERFSSQYGVDANVLRHIAVCESGFNPNAKNGTYAGLYQFASSSWSTNRLLMGESPDPDLRLNPEEATQTAAYLVSLGKKSLWPNCYP